MATIAAFVQIIDGDGLGLVIGQAGGIRDPDGDVVGLVFFEVQQAAVGHGDLAGGGIDREAAARIIRQLVAEGLTAIGIATRGDAHHGAVGR